MSDHEAPECQAAREALSGLIDGEEPGVSVSWLTEHLSGCAACREWYDAAREIRRRTRVSAAPAVPDLQAGILAAVEQSTTARRRRVEPRSVLPRVVLLVAALVLLWRSAPLILLGHDPDTGVHPAHELGAFEFALALALLWAVARPGIARTLAPIVGLVAGLLIVTAMVDLAHGGRTTWSEEGPHLLWLLAFAALLATPRTSSPGATSASAPRLSVLPSPTPSPASTTTSPLEEPEERGTSATHRSA